MEIFSNPLFATYSVYACNASIMGSQKLDCLTNKSICTSGCVCTAQTIHSQLLASVTLLPSLQFRLITSLHLPRSVTPLDFKSKSFTSSSTTSFHLFLALCLAPSTLKVDFTSSSNHRHRFMKHIRTITIYIIVPLLLSLLFYSVSWLKIMEVE